MNQNTENQTDITKSVRQAHAGETNRPARVAVEDSTVQIDGDGHPPTGPVQTESRCRHHHLFGTPPGGVAVPVRRRRRTGTGEAGTDAHRRRLSFFLPCLAWVPGARTKAERNRTRPPLPSPPLCCRAERWSAVDSTAPLPLHFPLSHQGRSRGEERNLPNLTDAFRPSSAPPHPGLPKYTNPRTASERYDPIQGKEGNLPAPAPIDPSKTCHTPSPPGPAVGPYYCRGPNAAGGESRTRGGGGGGPFLVLLGRSIDVSIRGPREPRRRRASEEALVRSRTGWPLAACRRSVHGAPRPPPGGRTTRSVPEKAACGACKKMMRWA